MGLFDGYLDPQQFQDSGGLLGRLLFLQQQQGQDRPGEGFDPQITTVGQAPFVPWAPLAASIPRSTLPDNERMPSGQMPTQNLQSQYEALPGRAGDFANGVFASVRKVGNYFWCGRWINHVQCAG